MSSVTKDHVIFQLALEDIQKSMKNYLKLCIERTEKCKEKARYRVPEEIQILGKDPK